MEETSLFAKICKVFSETQKCSQNDAQIITKLVTEKFKAKMDALVRRKSCTSAIGGDLDVVDTNRIYQVNLLKDHELDIFLNEKRSVQVVQNNGKHSSKVDTTLHEGHTLASIQDSIGTSDISSLITDLNSTYNSFAKNVCQRNSTWTNSQVEEDYTLTDDECALEFWDSKSTNLVKEADIQLQIIFETSKALNTCLTRKEFEWGPEYLEAEKILLLADFRRQHILNKLIESPTEETFPSLVDCVGDLSMADIAFPVKGDSNIQHNFVFIIIASHQNNAIASDIVHAQKNEHISFKKIFRFENLLPDFEIDIGIYALQMNHKLRNYSHESKFNLKEETTTCLSPSKLFLRNNHNNSTTLSTKTFARRKSSFVLLATTTVRIANLTKRLPILLSTSPTCSFLKSCVLMHFKSYVKFTSIHSSFLTIGTDVGEAVSWNRYWCVIEGYTLNYWSYPSEQDYSNPIGCIDFRYCINSRITSAERHLCARPKTLILETKLAQGYLQFEEHLCLRYYLSADTWSDFEMWQDKLNTVLSGLYCWNCMKL